MELAGLSILIAILALLAIFFNSLLFYLAIKIRHSSPDIVFVLAVSFVDFCCPIVIVADFVFLSITGTTVPSNKVACQVYGFFLMAYPMMASALASALAIKRYCHITQTKINDWFFIYPAVIFTAYFIMSCFAGSRFEFSPAPSMVHCQIFPATSTLSAIIFFLVDVVIFTGTLAVIYCYIKIAIFTVRTNNDILLIETGSQASSVKGPFSKLRNTTHIYYFKSVALRLGTIIALYILFMFPGSIFFILDGVFSYADLLESHKHIVSVLAIIFFFTGSVMNPVIILFLHSGIFNRMKALFTSNH